MEIERKYEIKEVPADLEQYRSKKIEQGYLCHNPVLRIRKSNEDYYLTYKSKDGIPERKEGDAIIHQEVELPLTKEAYDTLVKKTDGNIVYKTRYLIPLQEGLVVELDVFEGYLAGLIFAEVEFPNVKKANEFVPPTWMGQDISSDKRFSNYYLSRLESFKDLEI